MMTFPLLRAEGLIINVDKKEILVQCDMEESFYRLPGGSIEFGETASDAIKRELIEEFNVETEVGKLTCVNESIIEYDGQMRHECTLIHWCSININEVKTPLLHNEKPQIKLIWRTVEQLHLKPTYPEGILDIIYTNEDNITHILIEKSYD